SQRREPFSQLVGERAVDDLEDLSPGAEVRPQGDPRAIGVQSLRAGLEQLDVGVAEAVDRLLGVADGEKVVSGEQLDELELDRVGVLELIDHDPLKARAQPLAYVALVSYKPQRHQ